MSLQVGRSHAVRDVRLRGGTGSPSSAPPRHDFIGAVHVGRTRVPHHGESEAGKTGAARAILSLFALRGSGDAHDGLLGGTMAFGHAQTRLNTNS